MSLEEPASPQGPQRMIANHEHVYVAVFDPDDFYSSKAENKVAGKAKPQCLYPKRGGTELSMMQAVLASEVECHAFGAKLAAGKHKSKYRGLIKLDVSDIRALRLSFMPKNADAEDHPEPPCPGHGHVLYFAFPTGTKSVDDTEILMKLAHKHPIILPPAS